MSSQIPSGGGERGLAAGAPAPPPSDALAGDRIPLGGRSLREHTSRGVLINAAFQIGFSGLSVIQRFAVAAFLTAAEFGIWGLVLTTLVTLGWLKQVGISDKYVQQSDLDQEVAFQRAFSLELAYSALIFVGIAALIPVYGVIYDRPDFLLPALVMSLSILIGAFHAPLWVAYRQMRFVRQRTIEAINPVVSTIVMIGLAIAGAGYWSLVVGVLAGSLATAIAAVATSPYRLAWRFERETLREYVGFSWPLLLSSGAGLIVVQGTVIVGNHAIGLAGVGAIVLAGSVLVFSQRVEALINRSIYPAVCSVADDRARMFEAFVKSNRLGVMWGLPFGIAMLLFSPDLVEFVLGERWREAEAVLQALGLVVGLRQIGANWGVFMNATGNTRPVAASGVVSLILFGVATVPLMIAFGIDGYIAGTAIGVAGELAVRAFYLRRLFTGFSPMRHLIRAFLPSLPAVALIVAMRLAETGERTLGLALVELAAYCAATLAATLLIERRLLREIGRYLRPAAAPAEVGA